MSKKYDEYMSQFVNKPDMVAAQQHLDPQFAKLDPELAKEIRDRAIIELVKTADKVGMDLTYGDVLKVVDKDATEKNYEIQKASQEVK